MASQTIYQDESRTLTTEGAGLAIQTTDGRRVTTTLDGATLTTSLPIEVRHAIATQGRAVQDYYGVTVRGALTAVLPVSTRAAVEQAIRDAADYRAAERAAWQQATAPQRAQAARAAAWDRAHNEGGEGYNPFRTPAIDLPYEPHVKGELEEG